MGALWYDAVKILLVVTEDDGGYRLSPYAGKTKIPLR